MLKQKIEDILIEMSGNNTQLKEPPRTLFSLKSLSLESPVLRLITQKIQAVGGINLGQGTCQLPVPQEVIDGAKEAIDEGINRYTNSRGLISLRQAIAKKLIDFNGFAKIDPETEILITNGVTGAFEGLCEALIDPGDEVVSFEPFYPYHHKSLSRVGADVRYVRLNERDWTFTREDLERSFSDQTKFILVNTPSNPSGKVFTYEELMLIGEFCERYDCLLVTDEIYEYMLYDGFKHISPGSIPSLKDRVVTLGGYSKTFSITGWRIGYLAGPTEIVDRVNRVIDLMHICAPAPLQEGVARGIGRLGPDFYEALQQKYQAKRDYFVSVLQNIGLNPSIPEGSYYIIADYSLRFPDLTGIEFADKLISRCGVGAVPSNDFVLKPSEHTWVRFCYAVEDDVLERAALQLANL